MAGVRLRTLQNSRNNSIPSRAHAALRSSGFVRKNVCLAPSGSNADRGILPLSTLYDQGARLHAKWCPESRPCIAPLRSVWNTAPFALTRRVLHGSVDSTSFASRQPLSVAGAGVSTCCRAAQHHATASGAHLHRPREKNVSQTKRRCGSCLLRHQRRLRAWAVIGEQPSPGGVREGVGARQGRLGGAC